MDNTDPNLTAEIVRETKILLDLGYKITAATNEVERTGLARQINGHIAITETLMARARQLVPGGAGLPPEVDMLLAERFKAATEFLETANALDALHVHVVPRCANDTERANVAKIIAEGEAKCRELGNRILQLDASASAIKGQDDETRQ